MTKVKSVVVNLDKDKLHEFQLARLNAENIRLKAERVVEEANARVDLAWRAMGLEPNQTYDVDFTALTATLKPKGREK